MPIASSSNTAYSTWLFWSRQLSNWKLGFSRKSTKPTSLTPVNFCRPARHQTGGSCGHTGRNRFLDGTLSLIRTTGFVGWSLSWQQQERQQELGHELHQRKPVAPNGPDRMCVGSVYAEGLHLSSAIPPPGPTDRSAGSDRCRRPRHARRDVPRPRNRAALLEGHRSTQTQPDTDWCGITFDACRNLG